MLSITLEFVKGTLLIRLEGILTKETNKKLMDKIDEMIYEKGVKYFVLNLEGLESIDDISLNCLMKKYYEAICNNGKLIICGYNILNNNTINSLIENKILISNNELSALRMINI